MLQLKIDLTRCNLSSQNRLRKGRLSLKVKFKIRLTKKWWFRDSCLNKWIRREDNRERLLRKLKRLSSHKMCILDSHILTKSVRCLKLRIKNFRMWGTSTSSTWFVYLTSWRSRMSWFNSNLYQRQPKSLKKLSRSLLSWQPKTLTQTYHRFLRSWIQMTKMINLMNKKCPDKKLFNLSGRVMMSFSCINSLKLAAIKKLKLWRNLTTLKESIMSL